MKIKEQLQELEDEYESGYTLKTNKEIINIISQFGNGETEFHTVDIERLVVENKKAVDLIELFKSNKISHEIPNENTGEYNEGYVKAMCHAINGLKDVF
jgi:hypothetical protein